MADFLRLKGRLPSADAEVGSGNSTATNTTSTSRSRNARGHKAIPKALSSSESAMPGRRSMSNQTVGLEPSHPSRRTDPAKPPTRSKTPKPPNQITDPRFTHIAHDPRYRLPSRKETHVKLDKRFSRMLEDESFVGGEARVDRYGRRLRRGGKRIGEGRVKGLRGRYEIEVGDGGKGKREENEEGEGEGDEDVDVDVDGDVERELSRLDGELAEGKDEDDDGGQGSRRKSRTLYDRARQGGYSDTSSSEESTSSDSDTSLSSSSSYSTNTKNRNTSAPLGRAIPETEKIPTGEVTSRIAIVNLDWDNIRAVDLMAVAQSFCPPGGKVLGVTVYPSEFGRERMEREEREGPDFGERSGGGGGGGDVQSKSRGAGKIRETRVVGASKDVPRRRSASGGDANENSYSSSDSSSEEEEEEVELNDAEDAEDTADDDDEDEDNETIKRSLLPHSSTSPTSNNISTTNNPETDPHALRTYQLSRLRYFYAILSLDTPTTASHIYNSLDSQEYLSSANFFDLRFVPDEVTFDDPVTDRPRDSCTAVPGGYRPNEFVTEALTHSRVKLTWDGEVDGGRRREVQRRAFERGKQKGKRGEVDEGELGEWVGSGSSDDDDEEGDSNENEEMQMGTEAKDVAGKTATKTVTNTMTKKQAARNKMRALLGLPPDTCPDTPTATATTTKESHPKKGAPTGPMQITFTPGLSSETASKSIYTNKPNDVRPAAAEAETTREAYIRKERERKARRRERAKAAREGGGGYSEAPELGRKEGKDDDDDDDEEDDEEEKKRREKEDPFADPFFTSDPRAAQSKDKKEKKNKRSNRIRDADADAVDSAKATELAHLRAIMDTDSSATTRTAPGGQEQPQEKNGQGFNMAQIKKLERAQGQKKPGSGRSKKRRRPSSNADDDNDDDVDNNKRNNATGKTNTTMELDTSDPRFKRIHTDHEYAIDPTSSRFSGTRGMVGLLEEGRKRRRERE